MMVLASWPWKWSAHAWAGLTFLVLVAAALVAWRQAREARRLREEQARPFVIIDFHPWSTIIELTIKNVGATLARAVKFNFHPPLTTTRDETSRGPISDLNLFKNGIPSLAPGKEIKLFFDQFPTRVEQGLPMKYDVRVSYTDAHGKSYSEPTVLDLDMYRGTGGIRRNDIHDVHNQLEKLLKQIEKWTFFGGGLKVMGREEINDYNRELEAWYDERRQEGREQAVSGEPTESNNLDKTP